MVLGYLLEKAAMQKSIYPNPHSLAHLMNDP